MANVNSSIKLGSGFLLKNAPVDLKSTAATIEERNSYVDMGILYKGATVYVEADDTRYRFTGAAATEGDYSKCWVVDTSAGDAGANVDAAINEKIGSTIQAHSDQLDKVAALQDAGFVYRTADGTIQGMAVEAADASVAVTTDEVGKKVTVALPATGTAGTYFKVTTDAQGRVTAGETPTTVDGFGITDALKKTGDTATGLIKYADNISEDDFDENTLVPKKYADSVALGFSFHTACETGSSVNVEGTYAAGTDAEYPGVGATFTLAADTGNTTALSGVVLTAGMRVILVGQTDKTQNGAYVVTNVPEEATGNVVMQRVEDFDGAPHISYNGASFLISQGELKGTVWRLVNKDDIDFGTDNIEFHQTFAPTQYSAGAGIGINSNTISVKEGETVKVIGDRLEVNSGTGNQGKILIAQGDGAAATWGDASFDNINGVVPVAKGGTGATDKEGAFAALAPEGVKGDIMYHDGTKWVKLASGAANSLLGVGADGTVQYLTKIEQGTF